MGTSSLIEYLNLDRDPNDVAFIDADGSACRRGELLRLAATRARVLASLVPPGSRIGVVDTGQCQTLATILAGLLAERPTVLLAADSGADRTDQALAAACATVLRGDEVISSGGIAAGSGALLDPGLGADCHGAAEAVVLFTSGSTSQPRGVRLSHANLLSNLAAMDRSVGPWGEDARFGLVLSMAHSFGLSMVLLTLARRTPIVALGGGAPTRRLQGALDTHRVSVVASVPYYLRLLATRGLRLGTEFAPHLRSLFLAGGAIADAELADLLSGSQPETHVMYGLTEATARVAVRRIGDGAWPDSVGLPLPGTRVDAVGPQGETLPPGAAGRLRVTGPGVMMGYLGEPLRPAGEPFVTTDLGVVRESGDVVVTGRQADMLNFRGNRVSLPLIEGMATSVPDVTAARFIPDSPDDDARGVMLVVPRAAADLAAIRQQIQRVVVPRGLIASIEFVADLPTTRTGKPIRRRTSST